MRFQLPQFIETEVKIVGPFTLQQFLWVAGGAAFTATDTRNFSCFCFYQNRRRSIDSLCQL